jgi:hypothetical protein
MSQDDTAEVTRILMDYYKAFSTLDPEAIAPFFHEPSLLISPLGVTAARDGAAVGHTFTPVLQGLRTRGYGRSELTMLNVRQLSATVIWASGVAVRYKVDGSELERAGVTYVLNKAGSDWKMAVTILHDADRALRTETRAAP